MIPQFPKFKSLAWYDKEAVENITSKFPPYSDFNFVSLWSWDTRQKMKLSQLNDNVVILFHDYITETPFLSFIGNTDVEKTALELIDYSVATFGYHSIKLLPECVALKLNHSCFIVTPDKDAFDYILSVEYLSAIDKLPNSSNTAARNFHQFKNIVPEYTVKNCAIGDVDISGCLNIFKSWARMKALDHRELNEYAAFERFMNNSGCDNRIVSIFDDQKMLAFGSYELVRNGYAVGHFGKALPGYNGIYCALFYEIGKALKSENITYLNFEQDLGIPGLRQAKQKYKPVNYLRKYIVKLATI